MDGLGGVLVGLGHDIQIIHEMEQAEGLQIPGLFFTEAEFAYCHSKKLPFQSMAGLFSAKEALFKALQGLISFYWTDAEILHRPNRAPYFAFHGVLAEEMTRQQLQAHVSISHSGDYASAIVILSLADF
ncbi:MAG: holo-ACP synthase [Thermosynechococcaceae cyanobacterium MS004]|nr:holo-ACP synthase [Thermosynechococcaceae cyanobacterium MS004]